jgi:hypothetical protein
VECQGFQVIQQGQGQVVTLILVLVGMAKLIWVLNLAQTMVAAALVILEIQAHQEQALVVL